MLRGIGASLAMGFMSLFHPRILWLMLWPVLVAAVFWGTVVILFWADLVLHFSDLLREWIATATFFVEWNPASVAQFAAKVLVVIFIVPLIQFSALLVIGLVAMPTVVAHVAERRFPDLQRKQGGSVLGSLWNGLVALLGLALLCVVTLPLWLLPPLWPVIPVAILAWVNQRVLRYDAIAEHASGPEMQELFHARRLSMYLLGVLLALLAFIPIVGFFAPALFGLAFTHYLLAELKALREAPIEGQVLRV